MTNVSASVGAVLKPAGLDNSAGILSAGYQMDVTDPQWDSLSRHAAIPRLHGEVLSGSRQVRERAADGLQRLDRAGRGY